jgi:hypothetical protein
MPVAVTDVRIFAVVLQGNRQFVLSYYATVSWFKNVGNTLFMIWFIFDSKVG